MVALLEIIRAFGWSKCQLKHTLIAVALDLEEYGVQGGTAYGNTDSDAGYPTDHPVTPEDLAATIYWALGIDPNTRITDRNGRPVPIQDGGKPLVHLFS